MLLDIHTTAAFDQARLGAYDSADEKAGVQNFLNLLEKNIEQYGAVEPEPGLTVALRTMTSVFGWARTDDLKKYFIVVWSKLLACLIEKTPENAFRIAHEISSDSTIKGLVQSLTIVAARNISKANVWMKTNADNPNIGRDNYRIIQEVVNKKNEEAAVRSQIVLPLLSQTNEVSLSAEDAKERLRKLWELSLISPDGSTMCHVAAGLWANVFDSFAYEHREQAIDYALKLGEKSPSNGLMAKQIAASLLNLTDKPSLIPGFPKIPSLRHSRIEPV